MERRQSHANMQRYIMKVSYKWHFLYSIESSIPRCSLLKWLVMIEGMKHENYDMWATIFLPGKIAIYYLSSIPCTSFYPHLPFILFTPFLHIYPHLTQLSLFSPYPYYLYYPYYILIYPFYPQLPPYTPSYHPVSLFTHRYPSLPLSLSFS